MLKATIPNPDFILDQNDDEPWHRDMEQGDLIKARLQKRSCTHLLEL